jgi:hypothetical protein
VYLLLSMLNLPQEVMAIVFSDTATLHEITGTGKDSYGLQEEGGSKDIGPPTIAQVIGISGFRGTGGAISGSMATGRYATGADPLHGACISDPTFS